MNNHVENKPEHMHKWNLRNNNIKTDNSEDFQKVIIDHRSVLSHTTVKGLTKCGTIVNFETNKHSDFFNSKMGNKQDAISEIDNVCERKAIDLGINRHGTVLNEFLLDGKLCTVNGRLCVENDNFTFIDPQGRSVVDYFIVPVENMGRCKSFSVNTARDMIDLNCNISEEVYNIPGIPVSHNSFIEWPCNLSITIFLN